MKFKFCDLAHYSAMNLESFLDRNDIKFIKETSNDQVERSYDITIMSDFINIYAHGNYVHVGVIFDDDLITSTKIHITDFSTLKIF